ncbi:MAG TPA: malto-oligosyltrehalose trehalohydrolase [Gammaproteobacteria bacterium]|nr:malto-oligosyltrehalose trehalohydrolase [Gammaproteobacteria bacterium]
MIRRRRQTGFGAEFLPGGRVRFRLWAPAASSVSVVSDGHPEMTMAPRRGGWHELVTGALQPGDRYRYRIDGGAAYPDPASRCQPDDVHGPSEVIDPEAFEWRDEGWRGRPWSEAVIYELHAGTFTPGGGFDGVRERLDHLAHLGVTAIELMPVADFPGRRNWGYDGVLPFAPDSNYGRPESLKRLVQAAHARGLMILLDVVYNHFGPEGNYLHAYAPQFFSRRHHTPWGAGINFDGADAGPVRDFFVENALYWLEEYHLDGLRLDAVDTIADDSRPDILDAIAAAVHAGPARRRHVHLVLENDRNDPRRLDRPDGYTAQWNDDLHHVLHLLATGERDGYYRDYARGPAGHLARCLSEGFAYQGEPSPFRGGQPRGAPSSHLPPGAFVGFLQNHDQVGNRALGERITALAPAAAVRAALAILLLAPAPPLLFMGQEWGSTRPFLFFCDFEPALAARVAAGRRDEFADFPAFSAPAARRRIPDPGDPDTFTRCVLDWDEPASDGHAAWLALHRELLALRRRLLPALAGAHAADSRAAGPGAVRIAWTLGDGSRLTLLANLHDAWSAPLPGAVGGLLFAAGDTPAPAGEAWRLAPWSARWYRDRGETRK